MLLRARFLTGERCQHAIDVAMLFICWRAPYVILIDTRSARRAAHDATLRHIRLRYFTPSSPLFATITAAFSLRFVSYTAH